MEKRTPPNKDKVNTKKPKKAGGTARDNLYAIIEERKAYRNARREAEDGSTLRDSMEKKFRERTDEANTVLQNTSFDEAVARLHRESGAEEATEEVDQEAIVKEMGQSFAEIDTLSHALEDMRHFAMRRLLNAKASDNRYAKSAEESAYKTAREEILNISEKLDTLKQSDPDAYRAYELVEGRRALSREGHIVLTPTAEDIIERIGDNMLIGKPMLLHGPTGTGKTSYARYAARKYSGHPAEMVSCSPQTRESAMLVRTALRGTNEGATETVDIYGPLAKAIKYGRVVIFDEFTSLPAEEMPFLKQIMNAKVGDTVNILGNGTMKIAKGFQMIFTANLKSEKHPLKVDMPPEIAREFEQNNIKVPYPTLNESYDIMLDRKMEEDGSAHASWSDLQNLLPKLCEAMEEIQIAYSGTVREETATLVGVADVSGKKKGLKKLVMTQGTIEAIMDILKIERKKGGERPFAEFLDERLSIGLTFEEYPLSDRILAAKILALKGFLRTVSAQDLGLPKDTLDFAIAKDLRKSTKRVLDESAKEKHIPLRELVKLDPFGSRGGSKGMAAKAQKLAALYGKNKGGTPSTTETNLSPEALALRYNPFLEQTCKDFWGYTPKQITKAKDKIPTLPLLHTIDYQKLKDDIDPERVGEYTLNPETQEIDFANVEKEKIEILDLCQEPHNMQGKTLAEVAEYVVKTFGTTHHIPGMELWKWLTTEYDNAPPDVQQNWKDCADGNFHFTFGSTVRHSGGRPYVPYADRDGSGWHRDAGWLGSVWGPSFRVVLVRK